MVERIESSSLSEARYVYVRSAADGLLRVARIANHPAVYSCSAICLQASNEAEAVAVLDSATGTDYLSGEVADFEAAVEACESKVRGIRRTDGAYAGGEPSKREMKRVAVAMASGDHPFTPIEVIRQIADEVVKSEIRVELAAAAGNPAARSLQGSIYVN